MGVKVYHRDKADVMLPVISSDARLIVWPGVGAHTANMNYVRMEPGESNVPHVHRESEDTIFILEGEGTAEDLTNGTRQPFHAGQVIHVPAGTRHAVHADRGKRVVSVGGPCPADVHLLRAVGALPADE